MFHIDDFKGIHLAIFQMENILLSDQGNAGL